MILFSPKQRWIVTTRIMLLLVLLLSPQLLAQEKASKYSIFEEPSVTLGPWTGNLNVGPRMNATGKKLKGSRFVGQNLRDAVFDGCDLDGVRFLECDLTRASFKGASLSGAAIAICGLSEADFTEAIINGCKLSSSRMSEEQLKATKSYKSRNLSDCRICARYPQDEEAKDLVKYDFQNADMSGAALFDGDYSDCIFTDARIEKIRVCRAKIAFEQLASTCNYKQRRLRHMYFGNYQTLMRGPCAIDGKVDFSGIDLTGTGFRGCPLDADFSNATISECSFDFTLTKKQLCSTKNYEERDLANIRFFGINLTACDLSRQNLTGCEFLQCDFSNANFEDAVITDVDFGNKHDWQCKGLTLSQIKSTWNYKNNRMEGIILPNDIIAAIEMEKQTEKLY